MENIVFKTFSYPTELQHDFIDDKSVIIIRDDIHW